MFNRPVKKHAQKDDFSKKLKGSFFLTLKVYCGTLQKCLDEILPISNKISSVYKEIEKKLKLWKYTWSLKSSNMNICTYTNS